MSEHAVQLFDGPETLRGALCGFLYEGHTQGEQLLVAARPANWLAVLPGLMLRHIDVGRALVESRLTVLDARALLARVAPDGVPEAEPFQAAVGGLVEQLAARGPVRVYGEMVDLLAADGAFAEAHRLEMLWNGLLDRIPVTLLCGYSAAHFGHPRTRRLLADICNCHTHVRSSPSDTLATWLVGQDAAAEQNAGSST